MREIPEIVPPGSGIWTKATMILVRLVLVVFLVWVLFSAKIATNNPVAEDTPSTSQNSKSVVDPSAGQKHRFG